MSRRFKAVEWAPLDVVVPALAEALLEGLVVGEPERCTDVVGVEVAAVAVVDAEVPALIAAVDGTIVDGAALLDAVWLSVTPTLSHS